MNQSEHETDGELLPPGQRVALVGRLASTSHKDAASLIEQHGAVCVRPDDPALNLVVVGEAGIPIGCPEQASTAGLLSDALVQAVSTGQVKLIAESEFWQQLGVAASDEAGADVRLFTARMLAELLHVNVAVIRRWQRRGLVRPVKEVRRLAYFDFQEVAAARQLASLVGQGVSPGRIERQLSELARFVPGINRPLAQLAVLIEGRQLLLRSGEGLLDASGQRRFDFESQDRSAASISLTEQTDPADQENHSFAHGYDEIPILEARANELMPARLIAEAERLEDDGDLAAAAEAYRAALAAGGPIAEVNFALAELLYRQGDITAARERYYATLELDEDYVEARANLGCVLLELHEPELAVAAFEGALAGHPEYPDAHYHLARTLDELERSGEAAEHWREFLRQAPESPWADEARERLASERLAT